VPRLSTREAGARARSAVCPRRPWQRGPSL